jgi:hypothetical protein
MNTASARPRLVAILANAKPKPGERLVACAPVSVVLAADAKADAPLPTQIVWMPRGDHEICASTMSGGTWSGLVRCDELGGSIVVQAFNDARVAGGYRCWLDCNHDDGEASAWVRGFAWDPALGIVAMSSGPARRGAAPQETRLYSFSPTFWVDWESGRVSGLVEGSRRWRPGERSCFRRRHAGAYRCPVGRRRITPNPAPGGPRVTTKQTPP